MMNRASGMELVPTILLVDDRYTALVSLRWMLETEGYRLLSASSGRAALDAFRSRTIDLVVLDVVMPGMDGIEVAERLRSQDETRCVPIIFATGLPGRVGLRFASPGSAPAEVLTKPVDPALLKRTIARLLEWRAAGQRVETA